MKVFTIIESVDIDIISVRTFLDEDKANHMFDTIAEEQGENEIDEANWGGSNPATLIRFAGDDAYALELHVTETEN